MTSDTPEPDGNTHFVFAHKVFSLDGCYFEKDSTTRKPKFLMSLGEDMAAVALPALRAEFDIDENSDDDRLLKLIEKGLDYVKVIRPNDAIPSELLDGSASWTVEKSHQAGALDRVRIQLVTLLRGQEEQIIPLDEIEMLANDPAFKPKLPEAVALVSEKLGLGPEGMGEVINRIERIGHELSFIEGLRECFRNIQSVFEKVERLSNIYKSNTATWEEIDRILKLFREVITDVEMMFDMVDSKTCEIVTVLRSMDPHVQHIREARDDLHQRFMEWDEILEPWASARADRENPAVEDLIHKTYQFMARKYPQAQEWALGANA